MKNRFVSKQVCVRSSKQVRKFTAQVKQCRCRLPRLVDGAYHCECNCQWKNNFEEIHFVCVVFIFWFEAITESSQQGSYRNPGTGTNQTSQITSSRLTRPSAEQRAHMNPAFNYDFLMIHCHSSALKLINCHKIFIPFFRLSSCIDHPSSLTWMNVVFISLLKPAPQP